MVLVFVLSNQDVGVLRELNADHRNKNIKLEDLRRAIASCGGVRTMVAACMITNSQRAADSFLINVNLALFPAVPSKVKLGC